MARAVERPAGLKISRLAQRAGVPIPTIKHYLREGLIPRPLKTGRTMSYYDPECVDRIRQIKRLQSERFLPLSAIKKIIRSGKSIEDELALGEAMMCISEVSAPERRIPRDQIEKRSGYSIADLEKMERLGLIHPRKTERGKEYDPVDSRILALIRQREEAGFPLDYSLEMMSIYRKHIRTLVREDARLFACRLLPDASAREVAQYIREGDRALGAFMPLIREKLARENAERIIESMDGASRPLRESLRFRLQPAEAESGNEPTRPGRSSGPLWPHVLEALSGKRPPVSRDGGDLEALFLGLWGLAKGRPEEAGLRLAGAGRSGRVGPLCAALEGIAHLLKAPQAPGLIAGLQVMRQALGCLKGSRRRTPDPEVSLLASYFRGVGLAVLPDLFDTRGEAARDLRRVADQAGRRAESPFHRELRLKAFYFLVNLHVEDEAYGEAGKSLERLMQTEGDPFYRKWAARQRKRMGSGKRRI